MRISDVLPVCRPTPRRAAAGRIEWAAAPDESTRFPGCEEILSRHIYPSQDSASLALALNRDTTEFSDRERLLLNLLRPHIIDPAKLCAQGLTAREAEVLGWVAEGKTNWEMAAILGRSPRTVHHHLDHVYAKLGVETRTAAARRAREISDGAP